MDVIKAVMPLLWGGTVFEHNFYKQVYHDYKKTALSAKST